MPHLTFREWEIVILIAANVFFIWPVIFYLKWRERRQKQETEDYGDFSFLVSNIDWLKRMFRQISAERIRDAQAYEALTGESRVRYAQKYAEHGIAQFETFRTLLLEALVRPNPTFATLKLSPALLDARDQLIGFLRIPTDAADTTDALVRVLERDIIDGPSLLRWNVRVSTQRARIRTSTVNALLALGRATHIATIVERRRLRRYRRLLLDFRLYAKFLAEDLDTPMWPFPPPDRNGKLLSFSDGAYRASLRKRQRETPSGPYSVNCVPLAYGNA